LDPAGKKELEITINIPSDIIVYADSSVFQTVIRNLVSNSVKFTPRGGKIYISAKETNHRIVEISVRDTGIGMNDEMLKSLFRLDAKVNRKGTEGEPSTGLGLILCKDFIEKHNGKIVVESEEGKGSVFTFSMPVSE
jgi:signal transduction histidine kinase